MAATEKKRQPARAPTPTPLATDRSTRHTTRGAATTMSRADELIDQVLTADVQDLLAHDRRLAGVDLAVAVRGRVAHVNGVVVSEEERQLARRLIGRVRGIRAVWDLVRLAGEPPPRVVDIGCGPTKQVPSSIGIDRWPTPAVDVVADLERGVPLADDSVDHLFAVHVLEHIRDLISLMNDLHRVLRPGGVLHVLTPNWRNVIAVADPTHVRYFSAATFKYFCLPRPGVCPFWPLSVATSEDTVFVDLRPVKAGEPLPPPEVLARWFPD